MPSIYDETPIVVIENEVNKEEYVSASLLREQQWGSLRLKELKAGILTILGVIFLVQLPRIPLGSAGMWILVCLALFCFVLALFYLILMPKNIAAKAEEIHASNRLAALPHVTEIYRDRVIEQNDKEQLSGYWTDYKGCVESDTLFVLSGGFTRDLLILPKRNLTPEQNLQLREHLLATYAARYRRVKHK